MSTSFHVLVFTLSMYRVFVFLCMCIVLCDCLCVLTKSCIYNALTVIKLMIREIVVIRNFNTPVKSMTQYIVIVVIINCRVGGHLNNICV